jgi:predicted lipid-binding transport protein (Tim44 family)
MKKVVGIAALTLLLMSSYARADEHRGGDAALGALSGAVVFGPIGAIAGAAVGYTAGPSIARSWGFRRSQSAARRTRPARQDAAQAPAGQAPAAQAPDARGATATQAAAPVPLPAPRTASTAPPVQGFE